MAHEVKPPLTSLLATIVDDLYQDPANLRGLTVNDRAEVECLAELVARLSGIVRYESRPYFDDIRIIDLKKSSEGKG